MSPPHALLLHNCSSPAEGVYPKNVTVAGTRLLIPWLALIMAMAESVHPSPVFPTTHSPEPSAPLLTVPFQGTAFQPTPCYQESQHPSKASTPQKPAPI